MKELNIHTDRLNNEVIIRMRKAVGAGVSIKAIVERTGITYFRAASVINPNAYRGPTVFTDREVKRINKALDNIKQAF